MMAESNWWWWLAGLTVVAELLTGTFYLLMVAAGLGAGAVAAQLGLSTAAQLGTAAATGSGAVVLWSMARTHLVRPRADVKDRLNLDVGETVYVDAWCADGTGQARYRGTRWTVIQNPASAGTPSPGTYRVADVVGNRLVVEKI
jgi:membrane protein implicated in regulation of membrane protease activity